MARKCSWCTIPHTEVYGNHIATFVMNPHWKLCKVNPLLQCLRFWCFHTWTKCYCRNCNYFQKVLYVKDRQTSMEHASPAHSDSFWIFLTQDHFSSINFVSTDYLHAITISFRLLCVHRKKDYCLHFPSVKIDLNQKWGLWLFCSFPHFVLTLETMHVHFRLFIRSRKWKYAFIKTST